MSMPLKLFLVSKSLFSETSAQITTSRDLRFSVKKLGGFVEGTHKHFSWGYKRSLFFRGIQEVSARRVRRKIYSFKFTAICSFKETIFIEHCCIRGHSRNIYSKIVPSHLKIIINLKITIS